MIREPLTEEENGWGIDCPLCDTCHVFIGRLIRPFSFRCECGNTLHILAKDRSTVSPTK